MKKTLLSISLVIAGLCGTSYAQTNVFDNIIATSPNHTLLEAALLQEGLASVLQNPSANLTVFAPDDQAITSLATALNLDIAGLLALPNLSDILTYHVLGANVPSTAVTNGAIVQPLSTLNTLKLTQTTSGDIFVNQAEVTSADINSSNGVVHVIDAVLLPIATVVDLAINNNFSTLTAAVVKAELVPALSDPFSEFTVFAPTNAAFDNLATALGTNLNGILNLPNLQDILLYHVLDGIVQSTSLVAGPVETLNGSDVIVSLTSGVKINDANVILADVEADNGIVHVLDKVLLEDFLNLDAEIFKELSVSPNPATDFIAIENVAGLSYQLMDISGKVILSGTTQLQNQINIADLNAGIYNIRFEKDGAVKAIKVLKM